MNSIVIGGGNYEVGNAIMAERARIAQQELARQQMARQAAEQQQQMRQEQQMNAFRMQQAQQAAERQAQMDAFNQQMENAKFNQAQQYQASTDDRLKQEFQGKMDFQRAQLEADQEWRKQSSEDRLAKIEADAEAKREAIAQKSQAAAAAELKAIAKRTHDELALRREQVQRDLERTTTIDERSRGEKLIDSLTQDMLAQKDAYETGKTVEPSTDMMGLASWRATSASARAQMAMEEKQRKEEERKAKDASSEAAKQIAKYNKVADKNPIGALAALRNNPDIPEDKRSQYEEEIKLINPLVGELMDITEIAKNAPNPIQDIERVIANRKSYLTTPINQIEKKIAAIDREIGEGNTSRVDERAVLQKQWDRWAANHASASALDKTNPLGVTQTLVSRLEAQRDEWMKDPEMQAKARVEQAQEKTSAAAKNKPLQDLALGEMWRSHEAPLGRGLFRLFTGKTLYDIGHLRHSDSDRTQASRAMLAELVKRFPNKKRSEILDLMERAQRQFIGPPKVDMNEQALLSLE